MGLGFKKWICIGMGLNAILLGSCAYQQQQAEKAEQADAVDVEAYRIQIHNELGEAIRYRYARLVPHEETPLPPDPRPQATLDIGLVFETIEAGSSANLTLKPGKRLFLFTPESTGASRHVITADTSLDLYVTQTGIYQYTNGERVLIQIGE